MKNPLKKIETYDRIMGIFTAIGIITVILGAFSGTWLVWPCGILLGLWFLAHILNERTIDERDWDKLSSMEQFERIMRGNTPWNK